MGTQTFRVLPNAAWLSISVPWGLRFPRCRDLTPWKFCPGITSLAFSWAKRTASCMLRKTWSRSRHPSSKTPPWLMSLYTWAERRKRPSERQQPLRFGAEAKVGGFAGVRLWGAVDGESEGKEGEKPEGWAQCWRTRPGVALQYWLWAAEGNMNPRMLNLQPKAEGSSLIQGVGTWRRWSGKGCLIREGFGNSASSSPEVCPSSGLPRPFLQSPIWSRALTTTKPVDDFLRSVQRGREEQLV